MRIKWEQTIWDQERPNEAQIKAVSKLAISIGTLLVGSVVVRFFIRSTEEFISRPILVISGLLATGFFAFGTRILKGVRNHDS